MDVSDAVPCAPARPRVVHFDGAPITLENGDVLSPAEYPTLNAYIGCDLVVTDGNTLLGADDKAGIAEIMTAVEYFYNHPEIPHGTFKVAFTPDEEIGRGADLFDVEGFGAQFAYTLDGAAFGEVEYETFNATGATVRVKGKSIHPGEAKGQMVNAGEIIAAFDGLLPAHERAQTTAGYEGFYHLLGINASIEAAESYYILRDHDADRLEARKATVLAAAALLNARYGEGTVTVELTEQYRNMAEAVLPHAQILEAARAAVRAAGGEPVSNPVRGGTDGSRLSFMGLPCPNLGTGSHNHHGRFEYACVQAMDACTEMAVRLVTLFAEGGK
jgi:tripeptide aminopeptidase